MVQGGTGMAVKLVTAAMLNNTNKRLDLGKLWIDGCPTIAEGYIHVYGKMYSMVLRYQEARRGYFVTLKSHEDYVSFFADNGFAFGTSIAFDGCYNKALKALTITARLVVNGQMLTDPDTNFSVPVPDSAPVPVPRRTQPVAAPAAANPGPSAKAVRARRSPAKKSASNGNANRRISSRLANKQQVAAVLFGKSPSAGSPSPSFGVSVSINTNDYSVANILDGMDFEVTSAAAPQPFDALVLLAQHADAGQTGNAAAAVNANTIEALSPARDELSPVSQGIVPIEAIPAPQTTLDTYFSAKSSVLGKRKATDEIEVDSLKDATAASWAQEERAYEDAKFYAMMNNAKDTLAKLVATRVAGEKKKRKMSHAALVAPAPGVAVANITGAAPGIASVPVSTNKKSKRTLKIHGVARKVATKKAAAPRVTKKSSATTATKPRVDPCLAAAAAMDIDTNFGNENLGSLENGVRQSKRIVNRRSAMNSAAAVNGVVKVARRKQTAPTLAAL